jgi:hypothetical protein
VRDLEPFDNILAKVLILEALELTKEERKNLWPTITSRIYSSTIGQMNTIVIENEFNNIAEQQKHMEQVAAKEGWGSWAESWWQLVAGTSKNEVWDLE